MMNKRFYAKLLILAAVMLLGFQHPPRRATASNKTEDDKTRPQLVVQTGNDFPITALSFSPDSQYCATADDSGVVVLWDTEGKQLQRFQNGRSVNDVALSRDNRFLGSALSQDVVLEREPENSIISVSSVSSGREINRIASTAWSFSSISFSPNSNFLLSIASQEKPPKNSALLWDLGRKEIIHRFDNSIAAAFSPDGRTIITLEESEKAKDKETYALRWWDTVTWKQNWKSSFERTNASEPYNRLTYSYDGKRIMASSIHDSDYMLLDAVDGRFISHADCPTNEEGANKGHYSGASPFSFVSISANQQYILQCDCENGGTMGLFDNTVVLYDFATGNERRRLSRIAPIITTIMSTDGKHNLILTGDISGDAHVWDLAKGKEVKLLQSPNEDKIEATGQASQPLAGISMDGSIAFTEFGAHGEKILLWDVNTGKAFQAIDGGALSISLSMNGDRAVIDSCGDLSLVNLRTKRDIWTHDKEFDEVNECGEAELRTKRRTANYTSDGKFLFVGEYGSAGKPALLNAQTGRPIHLFSHVVGGWPVSLSPNGRYAAVSEIRERNRTTTLVDRNISLVDMSSGRVIKRIPKVAEVMSFSPDSRSFLFLTLDDSLQLFDLATGKENTIGVFSNEISDVGFSPDGHFILTGGQDGSTRLYSLRTGEEVCRFFSFKNGSWVVVGPDGRFDSNNLEEIKGLYWILPDEPLNALPPEVFMRDYYEPRLLPRILKGESLSTLPSLAKLNRLQPKIEKISVSPHPDAANVVDVTVRVASVAGQCLRDGKQEHCESGVYDLRLYRDGQLVKEVPAPAENDLRNSFGGTSWREHVQQWRVDSVVRNRDGKPVTTSSGSQEITFTNIQLPRQAGASQVEFTAYAFNEDRVKSATSESAAYPLPESRPGVQRRAYLITVGVDVTTAGWRLRFARNGVTEVEGLLQKSLGLQYKVVPVQLLSAYQKNSDELVNLTTKRNIQTVLNILSGRDVAQADRAKIPHQEQLQSATPDDLVILYIASHGYVDPAGKFYVIPSDIGPPLGVSEESLDRCLKNSEQSSICEAGRKLLARSISSDELTQWIEAIDAGQMVLILDSCHSGAVSGPGFKPGPMGDRSFGQLSYDKGMLVLTATQAEQLDTGTLALGNRSLLTYALTQQKPASSFDLRQWLSEAETQVPTLYEQFVKSDSPSPSVNESEQQPVLFDFSKKTH